MATLIVQSVNLRPMVTNGSYSGIHAAVAPAEISTLRPGATEQ
jgi:hypothetical protein